MNTDHPPPGKTMKRWVYILAGITLLFLFTIITIRFDYKGRFNGVFLLKGESGSMFVLTDDLFLGDADRLIAGLNLEDMRLTWNGRSNAHKKGEAYLCYGWDENDGSGFVQNYMPDGREIQTCFSRFNENGMSDHGVFIGGGLPSEVDGKDPRKLDETGMACFDGKNWKHIWCTTNEGIAVGDKFMMVPAYTWRYEGSKVVSTGDKSLELMSQHEVMALDTPLKVERRAFFRAGDPYFILVVKISNIGGKPARFLYCYGDEPWVGRYGTSKGNVGFVKDHLVNYAQWVDSGKSSFAGFIDSGNRVIGEGPGGTMAADFIEWLGTEKPSVYFSNGPLDAPQEERRGEPLESNERFICVEYGPEVLQPSQSVEYKMAIGMASVDPATGLPIAPKVTAANIL